MPDPIVLADEFFHVLLRALQGSTEIHGEFQLLNKEEREMFIRRLSARIDAEDGFNADDKIFLKFLLSLLVFKW